MIITIQVTSHFIKSFKNLPEEIKNQAIQKENIFKNNPYDPRLKTHRLKGKLKNYFAYSINYHYRILFRFINQSTVLYHDIGTHGIYQ